MQPGERLLKTIKEEITGSTYREYPFFRFYFSI